MRSSRPASLLLVGVMAGCSLFDVKPPPPPPPPPPPALPVADRFPFPAGTPVGAWVRWRYDVEELDVTTRRELAVIGRSGESLWIEELHAPDGFEEVVLRLVDPDGRVRRAYRGPPGSPGRVAPTSADAEPESPILALLAGRRTGQVVAIEDGTARVRDGVPFYGLVELAQGEPGEQLKITLEEHGTGRKAGKLKRELTDVRR